LAVFGALALGALSACAQGVQDNMPAEDNVDLGGTAAGGAGGSSSSAGRGGTATAAAGASQGGSVGSAGSASAGSGGKAGAASGGSANGGTASGGVASGGAPSGGAPSGGTASGGSAGKGGTASGGSGGSTSAGGTGSGGSTSAGGSAGAVASGGSGGTVTNNGISVQYKVVTADAMTPYIQCELYIVNAGPNTFALSDLKARYYYTDDVKTTTEFTLNWKHIGTSGANVDDLTVNETNMAMVPTKTNADTYLEFSFSSGSQSTISAGQSIDFSFRFNPQDQNLKFTQTNDYSFDASKTTQADWTHVVLFKNGSVIWGATP
jgi:hypothetical protein